MQNRERLQVQSTSVVDFNSTNMLDVSTITLYHVFKAYVSITVSKPLGLSFDAALSSGKNFTRWRHFKQQNE